MAEASAWNVPSGVATDGPVPDGGGITIDGDDLIVVGAGEGGGGIKGGGVVETHMDHRLAMSALMMGLASRDGVAVDDASFIDTSFPGFVDLLNSVIGNGGAPALVAA